VTFSGEYSFPPFFCGRRVSGSVRFRAGKVPPRLKGCCAGGTDGQGVGGGLYSLGTFTFDISTVIAKNHASTSNDDIFP
jgi:hypothetical protein